MVDFGEGNGLLVRLLRDVGLNAFWSDKYCENIFARGFEYSGVQQPIFATCFEVFEHLEDPLPQINAMLEQCPNLLFTTELLPCAIPDEQWWYYGFSHGQHISFYTKESLLYIARQNNLFLTSYNNNMHLFSRKKINTLLFKAIIRGYKFGLFCIAKSRFKSKTLDDWVRLSGLN